MCLDTFSLGLAVVSTVFLTLLAMLIGDAWLES